MDARFYNANAQLSDVGSVSVRSLRHDDKARLLGLFRRLMRRSIYFRFLGEDKKDVTPDELAYYTEIDFENHVALAACLTESGEERIVGVGRYIIDEQSKGAKSAEVTFCVADEYQGRGIGTALLDHLVRIARTQGIRTFKGRLFASNSKMFNILENSGFSLKNVSESGGIVHTEFSIKK
ncbi:GNAT family N-acetyltransferase [bacterium]|nr:GNAT family N-acetyltransferase [bacterium]